MKVMPLLLAIFCAAVPCLAEAQKPLRIRFGALAPRSTDLVRQRLLQLGGNGGSLQSAGARSSSIVAAAQAARPTWCGACGSGNSTARC